MIVRPQVCFLKESPPEDVLGIICCSLERKIALLGGNVRIGDLEVKSGVWEGNVDLQVDSTVAKGSDCECDVAVLLQ